MREAANLTGPVRFPIIGSGLSFNKPFVSLARIFHFYNSLPKRKVPAAKLKRPWWDQVSPQP